MVSKGALTMMLDVAQQHDELAAQFVIEALEATRKAAAVAIRGLHALDQSIFDAERERLRALSDFEDAEEDAPHDAAGDTAVAEARQNAVAAREAVLAFVPQTEKGRAAVRRAERYKVDSLAIVTARRAERRSIASGNPAAKSRLALLIQAADAAASKRRATAARRASAA